MSEVRSSSIVGGEREALPFILQIAAGVTAWIVVESLVTHRILGELLGFLAMWAVLFPFARRTWATGIQPRRYWMAMLFAAGIGAGLRLVLQ